MRSVVRIILLAFIVHGHAEHGKLLKRANKAWDIHTDLENTLLLKAQPTTITGSSRCSAHDQGAIQSGDFSGAMVDCVTSSLNIVTGVNENVFNQCFTGKMHVSTGCSTCFAETAHYDYQNCKLACMLGFSSENCVKCTHGFDTSACAGFHTPGFKGKSEQIERAKTPMISITAAVLISITSTCGIIIALSRLRRSSSKVVCAREGPLLSAA